MSDFENTRSLWRSVRAESLIAICALLVSCFATAASFWQTRVIAQQLSAQVWPYLSISITYSPASVSLDVSNEGLGPAIIRSATLSIDGIAHADPRDALRALVGAQRRRALSRMRDLQPGVVVRPSEDVRVLELDASWLVPLFAENAKRVDFSVCYCSLLGNCWNVAMKQTGDPVPLGRCPDVGSAQYRVPVVRSTAAAARQGPGM